MPISPPKSLAVSQAMEALTRGDVISFPTETVYGLGGDATNPRAVAKIFETKGRPQFNPLIVHVSDQHAAEEIGVFSPLATKLAKHFWPGALTLVVPRQVPSNIADLVTAGLATIALRVPAHAVAQDLLRAFDRPLAAPSANQSGAVSPTTADHVANDFGDKITVILDGGPTTLGLESTVVAVTGTTVDILRPGAITRQEIEAVIGQTLSPQSMDADTPQSPGQLASHYAPRANVRLNATHANPGEALLSFGPDAPATDGPSFNLSVSGDLREAAANFFAALRKLDTEGVTAIAVMSIPETGLGEAINDRLRRSAAPRP